MCVAPGPMHSLVVVQRGAVFSFGSGAYGQLGHGDQAGRRVPREVEALSDEHAVAVAAGWNHVLVVMDSGRMFTFGDGISMVSWGSVIME